MQYANGVEKLDRTEKYAKDKREASQQTLERLQQEYEQMDHDRRDNDRQVEELRAMADEVERNVSLRSPTDAYSCWTLTSDRWLSTCAKAR